MSKSKAPSRKPIIIAVSVILLIFLAYKIYYWLNMEKTDNAYVEADISTVSSEVPGEVREIFFKDNMAVKKGDIIAKIDDTIYKAKEASARSTLKSAELGLEMMNQQIELEEKNLKNAEEALEFASVNLKLSEADFKRNNKLHEDNFSSQQKLDKSKVALEKSRYELAKSELAVEISKKKLDMLKTEKLKNLAELEGLGHHHKIALDALDNTSIKSPIDGIITASGLRIGNNARPGMPLFYVVPSKKYIRANFKETQIEHIKIGQEVTIKIDAISDNSFKGKVSSIYPATGAKFALIPPDNATGNFTKIIQRIPVIINIDDNQENFDKIRAGMSCEVTVNLF